MERFFIHAYIHISSYQLAACTVRLGNAESDFFFSLTSTWYKVFLDPKSPGESIPVLKKSIRVGLPAQRTAAR